MTTEIRKVVDKLVCFLGSHFWVEEADDYELGTLLRSRCCGRLRTLKEKPSDWFVVGHDVSVGEDFTYGATHSKLREDWWLASMRWQRWDECKFRNCAGKIRSSHPDYCLFHHRHVVELRDILVDANHNYVRG